MHAPACMQNRLDNRQSYISGAKRQQRKHANVRNDTAQDCEGGCRFALNLGLWPNATSTRGHNSRPGSDSGAKQRDRKCCDTTRRKVQGTGCGRGECCKRGPLAGMLPVQAKTRCIRMQQSGKATIMGAVWQTAHTWSRDGACSGSLSQALGKLLLALAANPPQTPCRQSSTSMVCLFQVVYHMFGGPTFAWCSALVACFLCQLQHKQPSTVNITIRICKNYTVAKIT